MLLADLLLPLLQAAAYALIALTVWSHSSLRALGALCARTAAQAAVAAPALRPLLSALFALPPRGHIGSRPRPPTILGVAIAEEIADEEWPAAVEALGRLIAWAQDRGFRLLLIYEPSGRLQQHAAVRQLELELLQHRLCGTVSLQVGWPLSQGSCLHPADPADDNLHSVEDVLDGSSLQAVLLTAADGEWPVLAAAAEGQGMTKSTTPGTQQESLHGSSAAAEDSRAAAIDGAIAAPGRVRRRLQAAAGALAGAEPDFLLVTGPALTLAGFPAWAVRASEIYGVGQLAALQGRQQLDAALRRFCGTKQRWGQ